MELGLTIAIVTLIVTALAAILAWLVANRQAKTEDKDLARDRRNRQALLKLVEDFWVKGILENSLHGAVLIELDLEERKEAIEHPLDMELRWRGQTSRDLPPDVKMAAVFDEVGQNLLILGDPSSGKTTMLLELAREMIARARRDDTRPIPVVFNLSSWNDPHQSIADWLVVELNTKYNIPKKIAQGWVENDALLLLLDGLDEVAEGIPDMCVKAINEFRQAHLVPVVVCSRIADYERLSTRLKLESAVFIKPLTPEKIDQYLSDDRLELGAVIATLRHDKPLQELVKTPLMLSIMTLAYQGLPVQDLHRFDTLEARRKHLFNTYIKRMFKRRRVDFNGSKKQMVKWLGWLAQRMVATSRTEFLIERMQPDWLETGHQKWVYSLIVGLISGLIVGLMFGLISGLSFGLIFGLSFGLSFGLISGLLDKIVPVEVLGWSWNEAISSLISGLRIGLIAGLIGGLIVGLIGGLRVGLSVGLLGWLLDWLLSGSKNIETRVIPNQGIWQSGKNGLIFGLIFGLIVGLIFELSSWLISELVFGLSNGLSVGLSVGLAVGGLAFLQHFALRFILWVTGQLPWRLIRFLDYAADLIFLRKVGGGYIFIHRLLLEHFAAMEAEQ